MSIEDRFWALVDIKEDTEVCWEWQGASDGGSMGYGSFRVADSQVRAHRMAFWLWYGWWPEVCRHYVCNNPGCCNPYHLRDGTLEDNNRDMQEQGRGWFNKAYKVSGYDHGNAKLTPEDIELILSSPLSATKLAESMHVSQPVISRIRRNGGY